jgi:hypothetical protein
MRCPKCDVLDRISGSKLQIDRLKAELNTGMWLSTILLSYPQRSTGATVELHEQDIHAIASLIKLWIREIPDGLMPDQSFWLAVEAVRKYSNKPNDEALMKAYRNE